MLQSVGKTLKVLRNNWKKSVFGSVCLFYAGKLLYSRYRENLYLRVVCEEAKAFGDAPLPTDARLRHVTVILNPAANDRKCKAQFDKYCGPLLNLAGLKVGIIRTEKEGQAKELMEIMDNTDAVVIAGGDGTVAEVVTGLMRRSDRQRATRRFPLAVIPLGRTNSTAAALLQAGAETDAVRLITQSTLALIRQTLRPLDVMEVRAVETAAELPGRPVYLLSDVWWGAHRDVHVKTHQYWYWGALKKRMAYIFNVFRDLTWRCDADMEYTSYCAGCSRCHPRQEQQQLQQPMEKGASATRWWARFIPQPKSAPRPAAEPEVDFSAIENALCGVWRRQRVSGVEWRLRTSQLTAGARPGLHLTLGPEAPTSAEFISEGWRRASGERPSVARTLTVGQVRLIPAPEVRSAACRGKAPPAGGDSEYSSPTAEEVLAAGSEPASAPDADSTATEEQTAPNTRWFSFDSEEFEVRPVLIKLVPRAVRVFAVSGRDTGQTAPVS